MNNGVIYYNVGRKCLIRLCVSIHSLRKHYDGNITVLFDDMEPWVRSALEKYNVLFDAIPSKRDGNALVRKSQLWKYSPYDVSVFFDADVVIMKPIDYLFEVAEQNEFFTTHFSTWKTTGGTMSKRIRAWEPVIGASEVRKALDYGVAVNTGVFGWHKDAKILKEWDKITVEGCEKNCTRRLVDEVACQVLLHKYPHKILDYHWNASVKYAPNDNPCIIHYHGSKHVHPYALCEVWKDMYWEMRNTNRQYHNLATPNGDRRFNRYLKSVVKSDLTIVSSVNDLYLYKLNKNIHSWMNTKGLREQKFLIFVCDFELTSPKLRELSKYKNVQLATWSFQKAGGNIREKMLSSFIFGTATHVKTDYWMKLDCDARPVADTFVFPDYHKYTIVGHKWGYTKVKGDPTGTDHWFNILDDWWGDVPYFPKRYSLETERRVRHKRFCSFCYFEKTSFTRRMAVRCGDRMPIPSQDTTSWYVATRWNEPILRANFRQYIKA